MKVLNYFLIIALTIPLNISCGDDASSVQYSLNLEFTRIIQGTLNPFRVDVTLKKDGTALAGQALNVSVDNPNQTTSAITDNGSGTYSFTVTPARTGEFPVTVSNGTVSITRTALVLYGVHADWGQPMSVPGLANTAGYEDGVTITPDGEYLFVHTGPYYFSSIFVYWESRANGGCGGDRLNPDRCEHPWVNETIGPYTAPERPGFFDGRFSGTSQLHNAASWGVGIDEAPNYALSTMFFGFKRQADGTFTEPFYIAFNDMNDGIIGPYGLSFMKENDGTYTIIFSLGDSFTTEYKPDIYTASGTLGQNINLGDYEFTSAGNPPARGSYFPSTLVDFGDNTGTQGNPFLYYDSDGNVKSIWTDDEYDNDADTKKLTVYVMTSGTFPSGGTWTKVLLPSNVNQDGKEAIQPAFTDNGLYFTQDTNVVFSAYLGAHNSTDYSNNTSWNFPDIILQKDISIASLKAAPEDIGKIIAIGEPTVAAVDGKTTLYFVYGYIRSLDSITGIADIDMQAGFIEKK